jgi:hypothetical protein
VLASTGVVRRTLPLILLALLVLPAIASASGRDVIRNCEEYGELTKSFSRGDLQSAIDHLPDDLKEYSNCEALIAAALQHARNVAATRKRAPKQPGAATAPGGGGGSGGGGSGGSSAGSSAGAAPSTPAPTAQAPALDPAFATPSAEEDQAVDKERFKHGAVALSGGITVEPGSASAAARGLDALPAPLRVLLAALAFAALLAIALLLRHALRGGPSWPWRRFRRAPAA